MALLPQDIDDVRVGIKTDRYTNEASVSHGIVSRFLQALSGLDHRFGHWGLIVLCRGFAPDP